MEALSQTEVHLLSDSRFSLRLIITLSRSILKEKRDILHLHGYDGI